MSLEIQVLVSGWVVHVYTDDGHSSYAYTSFPKMMKFVKELLKQPYVKKNDTYYA